jgi:PilZ domain
MKPRSARIGMVAPVRVFGLDAHGHAFNHRALTIDVSLNGARIEVVNCPGLEGQTIGVRYGDEKARFRVVWMGTLGPKGDQQVGLYCVEPGEYIWDAIPPEDTQVSPGVQQTTLQPQSALFQMASSSPSHDRRLEERVSLGGSAQLRNRETNAADWAALYDLSPNGCYLETRCPWPVATHVELTLEIAGIRVQAEAQVITSHPMVGMGLRFVEMSRLNRQRLEQVFATLGQHCAEQESANQVAADQCSADQSCAEPAGTGRNIADQYCADQDDEMSSADAVTLARLIGYRPDDAE